MIRSGFLTVAAMVAVFGSACAGQTRSPAEQTPVAGQEGSDSSTAIAEPGLEAYQPRFGRTRPVVAVVGPNDGAELTDYVVPHGILTASGVADVVALSTEPGPIEMFPALTFEVDATIAEFDREYPDGADYVIVPAVHDAENPRLSRWILDQAAKGATLVGVCDGVLVLAKAGVLDGRRATAHWYSIGGLEESHPGTDWVRDRRYVADGKVITTTGVSASIPVSLALVEAIAGWDRAREIAEELGVEDWSVEHDSDAYGITAGNVLTAVANMVAFWRHETLGIEVAPGVDPVSLALMADAWSRTSRSRVVSVAAGDEPIQTRGGLRIVPDRDASEWDGDDCMLPPTSDIDAGSALDLALEDIEDSYGARTADYVALQLEYPRSAGSEGRAR